VRHFVLHSGLPSKAWLAQARQGQAQYFIQCMDQIGEQEMDAATVRARRWCQIEIENLAVAIEHNRLVDSAVAASMVCKILCCLWNNGYVDQAKHWIKTVVAVANVKLINQDEDRLRLFDLHFIANYGRVIDAEELVNRELKNFELEFPLSIPKVALISFCLQYLRRVLGHYDQAYALGRRMWESSNHAHVDQLLRHEAAIQWAGILVAVGEFDQLDRFLNEYRSVRQTSKDKLQLAVYSATSLAMQGRFRNAIDTIDTITTSIGERSGIFWATCKCTIGLLAIDFGRIKLAEACLEDVDASLNGRNFSGNMEVLRKQLEIFVEVLSRKAAHRAVSAALVAMPDFESTSARCEWIGVCIEVTLLAGDLAAANIFVKMYCDRLCPLTFLRSFRVAEALGGYAMLLGESSKANAFYSVANLARRMTNGKMLPIHADLRKKVGATTATCEGCEIFANLVLADLSGKRFWQLVSARAQELIAVYENKTSLKLG
jgi:tetratricopeptide (TPR) repeat protein